MTMLKGKNLSFRYTPSRPWILKDFSITISAGEIVGLYGPSGRGKTTLAKLLAGYLVPTQGRVTVADRVLPPQGYNPVQLIFQNPELAINPRWRVAQILSEGQMPSPELLQALSIDFSWLSRWPHELSGGELQRVAVARALGSQPHYLITDEMTAMLDANTQASLWQAVTSYARHYNLGVLVISHEAPLLQRLCDHIIDLETAIPILLR